ncbi:MAG: nucleotidyltransferase domain-containing protein [archaeon]
MRASREKDIMYLFFNHPSKQWHFSQIKKEVLISDSKISKWLKKFQEEKLIIKIKPKEKMPYYIGNYESPEYINTKKLFGMNMLHQSGLLNHLYSLENTKTIIIFGSFSVGFWHSESDIDLFIYGNNKNLNLYKYEKKLGREIQLFSCNNFKELRKYHGKLAANIIKGDFIKGYLSKEALQNVLQN